MTRQPAGRFPRAGGLALALILAGCAAPDAPVYGLRPVDPKPRLSSNAPRAAFVEVRSLYPLLQWEAFPTDDDRKADRALSERIREVTYELRIFRAVGDYPGPLIYVRRGLPNPAHALETPLPPSAKYFWTVRARFELDGRIRVTPWGRLALPGLNDFVVPSAFYYGMETPSK